MSYEKALKKLENLPSGERQLASGYFVKSITRSGKPHCGCSVGKVLSQKDRLKLIRAQAKAKAIEKKNPESYMTVNPNIMTTNPNESGARGLANFLGLRLRDHVGRPFLCGMTFAETDSLICKNDSVVKSLDGKENTKARMVRRYKLILKWLRKQVREEEENEAL